VTGEPSKRCWEDGVELGNSWETSDETLHPEAPKSTNESIPDKKRGNFAGKKLLLSEKDPLPSGKRDTLSAGLFQPGDKPGLGQKKKGLQNWRGQ